MSPHKSLALAIKGLHRHYKDGGRYRVLHEHVAVSPHAIRTLTNAGSLLHTVLYPDNVFHSDDARVLDVICTAGGIIVSDLFSPVGYTGVLYISLDYGSIWLRRYDEFHGAVEHEGAVVNRFTPVDRFPPPIRQLPPTVRAEDDESECQ
jgi:hypothetical protein